MHTTADARDYCVRIESWLVKSLGARGTGFRAKLKSVEGCLEPELVRVLREINRVRNPLMHTDEVQADQEFVEECRRAYVRLRAAHPGVWPSHTREELPPELCGVKACLQCGRMVSRAATRCPACGIKTRLRCHVCLKEFQEVEPGAPDETKLYCQGCFDTHFADAVYDRCQNCSVELGVQNGFMNGFFTRETLSTGLSALCWSCGGPNPFSVKWDCEECGAPIISRIQKAVDAGGRIMHDFCWEMRYGEQARAEQAAVEANRRAQAMSRTRESRRRIVRACRRGLFVGMVPGSLVLLRVGSEAYAQGGNFVTALTRHELFSRSIVILVVSSLAATVVGYFVGKISASV